MECVQSSVKDFPFKKYLSQMESKIGKSDKSLHELLSNYLELKNKNPELASQVVDLEMLQVEELSREQLNAHLNQAKIFDQLRLKALQGNLPSLHPWFHFVTFEHEEKETESFIRTMRLGSIQFHKIWIEIQSIPMLSSVLDKFTLEHLEILFAWMAQSPKWSEVIAQPKIITHFIQMSKEQLLADFMEDFKSMLLLKDRMKEELDPRFYSSFDEMQKGLNLLHQMKLIIDQNQLQEFSIQDLQKQVEDYESKRQKLLKIQGYLQRMESEFHCPIPKNLKELEMLRLTLRKASSLSKKWIELRNKKFLFASVRQIQSWHEEAEDLMNHALQVEALFEKNSACSSEDLNKLALELNSSSAFRSLSPSYQKAVQKYRSLLKENLRKHKQTAAQMVENILLWSDFLEKKEKFETEEKKNVLEDYYLGVNTNFSLILEAIRWRQAWESDLVDQDPFYGKRLLSWIFDLNSEQFEPIVSQEDFPDIQALDEQDAFESIEKKLDSKLESWNQLVASLKNLNYTKKISLSKIFELESMLEKMLSLSKKMDRDGDLKQWIFSSCQETEADLKIMEQGLFFIQSIQSSLLPDFLKKFFLSGSIPQKLIESQPLFISIGSSFHAFKESLEKIQERHGTMEAIMQWTPSVFLERLQKAFKQAESFSDWVAYLRCEQETRKKGLSSFLDIYEQSFSAWPLQTVYELIASASLLKLGLDLRAKSNA